MDANLIGNCLKMLDACYRPEFGVKPGQPGVDGLINLWFLFSFAWTFGGNLREESRVKFDAWMREEGMIAALDPAFPEGLTVFDCAIFEGAFVPWTTRMTTRLRRRALNTSECELWLLKSC